MKATDFRPEHFEKGRGFSRADFDAYIAASGKLTQTMYTRYLPCVAGGILASLLFSKGLGAFVGNILAVLCIFAGLIAGGVFNMKASRAVKECAQRLGVTNEDVKLARQHVKSGTLAWNGDAAGDAAAPQAKYCVQCGAPLLSGAAFCTGCGAKCESLPGDATKAAPIPMAQSQAAPAIPIEAALAPDPRRAVWMAGSLLCAWFLLLVLQLIFGDKLMLCGSAFLLLDAGLLGAAVYLMAQSGLRWKLLGGGAGLVAAFLLASSYAAIGLEKRMGGHFPLRAFFRFRDPLFMRDLGIAFLCVLLCLGVALLICKLHKEYGKKRVRLCALLAAAVYLLMGPLFLLQQFRAYLLNPIAPKAIPLYQMLLYQMLPAIFGAAAIYLVCMAAYALCTMRPARVKLHGMGLVWAWLAVAGALVTIISIISAVTAVMSGAAIPGVTRPYAFQFIVGICALAGYILLLCKKRVGLYVILLGMGLPLAAQLISATNYLRASYGWVLLISSLLGAVNPLFAYLAVRAGFSAPYAGPAERAAQVDNRLV